MERKKYTGLRLVIAGALVTQGISACFPRKIDAVDATPTALEKNPTATYYYTPEPDIRDYLATNQAQTVTATPRPTETPIPTPTIPERFKFGTLDFSNTPFTMQFSTELNKLLGYIEGANRLLTGDVPLPITGPLFGTDEQYETFEKARYVNLKNPYFVMTTDLQNHIMIYPHSISSTAPGEIARKITSFQIQNPDKKDTVLGHKISFTIAGQTLSGEVVHTDVITEEKFYETLGVYHSGEQLMFLRTDTLGIPKEIRDDKNKNTFYVTFVTCQSVDGKISLLYSQNIAMRAIVTVKFTK